MSAPLVRPTAHVLRCWVLRVMACMALFTAPASRAELGGDLSSIDRDQVRLKGERHQVNVQTQPRAGARVQAMAVRTPLLAHEITQTDGSIIREFLSPSGIVYAVAWQTHFKPDLGALFGQHAAHYAVAAKEAMKTPGIKRNVVLQGSDLVVHATSHYNVFIGQAYVPSLVPVGVDVHDLR